MWPGTAVAALLVYLGWVRSVNTGMGFDPAAAGMSDEELTVLTQSPDFIGRAIAVRGPGGHSRKYGFTDVDGRIARYEGGE